MKYRIGIIRCSSLAGGFTPCLRVNSLFSGLDGYSDADVLLHAVMDALLVQQRLGSWKPFSGW